MELRFTVGAALRVNEFFRLSCGLLNEVLDWVSFLASELNGEGSSDKGGRVGRRAALRYSLPKGFSKA